jgi:hypothetical protein
LAAAAYLVWHPTADVLGYLATLNGQTVVDDGYLKGDCTVVVTKSQ